MAKPGFVAEIRSQTTGHVLACGYGSRPYVAAQRGAARLIEIGGGTGGRWILELFVHACSDISEHGRALCSCPVLSPAELRAIMPDHRTIAHVK